MHDSVVGIILLAIKIYLVSLHNCPMLLKIVRLSLKVTKTFVLDTKCPFLHWEIVNRWVFILLFFLYVFMHVLIWFRNREWSNLFSFILIVESGFLRSKLWLVHKWIVFLSLYNVPQSSSNSIGENQWRLRLLSCNFLFLFVVLHYRISINAHLFKFELTDCKFILL